MNRKLIKALRVNKSLNQYQFSELIGISRALLAQIEAGYVSPSHKVIQKIYDVLDGDYIQKVRDLQ
ncbi:helix-turn-helix domain-containing protein [Cytobacillus praedii]|uniref:helix-turn-helix domain-containing protein n=1 Tax=Cytobacillus praedii TaxID=1742358 RepID=UPI00070E4604|nr:helix-turn-helix transcriptional regulator [Cytobacillus praedii]